MVLAKFTENSCEGRERTWDYRAADLALEIERNVKDKYHVRDKILILTLMKIARKFVFVVTQIRRELIRSSSGFLCRISVQFGNAHRVVTQRKLTAVGLPSNSV